MKLKLCPAGTALVPYKHAKPGQMARYIGRVFEENTKGWPAEEKPAVIDTETARPDLVTKIYKRVNSGDLFPADAETAALMGVKFRGTPVFRAGVWSLPETQTESPPTAVTRRRTVAVEKGTD